MKGILVKGSGLLLGAFCLGLSFSSGVWATLVDDTTCTVLSQSDDVGVFHSLRRKVVEGFNRSKERACVET